MIYKRTNEYAYYPAALIPDIYFLVTLKHRTSLMKKIKLWDISFRKVNLMKKSLNKFIRIALCAILGTDNNIDPWLDSKNKMEKYNLKLDVNTENSLSRIEKMVSPKSKILEI